ncbi:MAG: TonB-dependent receptor [Acidobacteriota bacterium]
MSKSSRILVLFVVAIVTLTGALLAQSQATTGVIEGTVVDPSGAALPGATVAVKNTATNFEKTITTEANGRFRALLLPLGPYQVTASLQGFATLIRDGLDLQVGQSVNLQLQMQISAVQEQITVSGEAPTVETTRTEGSTRIDVRSIQGLPNNGRNFLDYTKLTPGVTTVQGPDGDELSINGQKGISNNVSVDGADFNNPFFGEQRGGQRPPFTFNLDAVQEVVVVADGAPAEFGRSQSGFVNVVTKSGTNSHHGTAHAFYKNDSLSSPAKKANGAEAKKFPEDQGQYGFTLGGPVSTDHVFYFIAGDVQKASSTKQNDPNRIEPAVLDYFNSIGITNENGSIDRTNDATVLLGKLDWQASADNLFSVRLNYTKSEQKNGTFDVDSWGRSANATEKDDSHSISGSIISTLSDNYLNEFRFQYARENRPRSYDGPINAATGRPLPDTAFDFANSYRFGMPFFIPVKYYDERYQANDNLSILHGNHNLKAGLEYNWVSSNQTFVGFANGRYIFDSTAGFLNFARNPKFVECSDGSSSQVGVCPAGTSITGPVLLYLQQAGVGGLTSEQAGTQKIPQKEPAVFAQDKWQPRSNLTFQYGLRWEAQIEPDPITPPNQVFFKDFIGKTVNTAAGPQTFPSNGKIPSDYAMWQPRLGVTWDPQDNGRSVIRATAGIFYGRVPGLNLASTRSTNGSRGQNLFRSSPASPFLGPVPAYGTLITRVGDPFDPDVFVFDRHFKNPRTYAASLSYERELTGDLGFLVKYNYAKGEHISRFVNRNDPLLGSPWGTGLGAGGANGIATLTTVESTARSLYNGVTLGLNKRWSHNFQYQIYYTYSKDKSDDDNERDPFSFRYAKVTDLNAEYGYSDRDQRDRFNAWLLYRAPGDVDINVRYAYRSAQPQSITASGAVANAPTDRINPDGSVTQRNLGRKDNVFNSLDLRVSRPFHVGAFQLEPILEVFNLFNSANFRRPEVTNLIFNFDGTVQSGDGDPRQIQVGLRFVW